MTTASRDIQIDPAARFQMFHGWGTSLAWWANAVGRLAPATVERIVESLYGTGEGMLGMNIARFNAGGGEDPARRTTLEPRMTMPGYRVRPGAEFDADADPGQRAVLASAGRILLARGQTLLTDVFGNSPPWWATISGSVTGNRTRTGRAAPNLAPAHAEEYLVYLADVARTVARYPGVEITGISPFNEPTSGWWKLGGKQEGCHFTREGVDALLVLAQRAGLPAPIVGTEEWSIDQAVRTWDALGPQARRGIGRLAVHTYDGVRRSALRARAAAAGIPIWVSEYGDGHPDGLAMAETIVTDLRELGAEAWVLWQAISPDAWGLWRGYPDTGELLRTPKFHAFEVMSRVLRPGSRIIGTDDPRTVAWESGRGQLGIIVLGEPHTARNVRIRVDRCEHVASATAFRAAADFVEPFAVAVSADTIRLEVPRRGIVGMLIDYDGHGCDDPSFLGSGEWTIETDSGGRLDVDVTPGGDFDEGARVVARVPDEASRTQRWRFDACGDGAFRIVNVASGHALDVARSSWRNGAHVVQWWCGTATSAPPNQRWFPHRHGEHFRLESLGSGYVLGLRTDPARADVVGLADQDRVGAELRLVRVVGPE